MDLCLPLSGAVGAYRHFPQANVCTGACFHEVFTVGRGLCASDASKSCIIDLYL